MKSYREVIEDIKYFLYVHMFNRFDVESRISSYNYDLNKYLCRMIADPNNINFKQWFEEVYEICSILENIRYKKDNLKPLEKDILVWLFDEINESEIDFKDMINSVIYVDELNTKYNDSMWNQYNKIKLVLCRLIHSRQSTYSNLIKLFRKTLKIEDKE